MITAVLRSWQVYFSLHIAFCMSTFEAITLTSFIVVARVCFWLRESISPLRYVKVQQVVDATRSRDVR